MKVYVITQGDYSAYHICAVTLDDKEAKRLAKVYSETDDPADVEEYDTDDPANKLGLDGRVPYWVRFEEDGHAAVYMSSKPLEKFRPQIHFFGKAVEVELFAPDADAAVKIAAEKRAQAMAEREGLT